MDSYIRGVVAGEMPSSWPLEALKAQAVAARSYALGTGTGNAVFDHYDTVASQVYGGYSSENVRTNRAVARTSGEVLRHNGEVIVAYSDGSMAHLPLHNPTNWWPIDRDYFIDDFQFRRPGPIPSSRMS